MKYKLNRIRIRRVLSIMLICLLLFPYSALAEEETDVISIFSADDLIQLQRNCSYDVWSNGKTVILEKDISMAHIPFAPIAYFAGTFEGGGHTISGLMITESSAPAGLFAEIAPTGLVADLHVNGSVLPTGEQTQVGGIAGINGGTIRNCTFVGTVKGDTVLGGIARDNAACGTIEDCKVSGTVYGVTQTGGIAGSNHGTIQNCTNAAYVNTQTMDPILNLSELGIDSYSDLLTFTNPDTYNISTDCGGIAGYNAGYLLSCTNEGTVGYEHIGYNVGGIVGRNCGFLSGCSNAGQVFGRKDVGGIAGLAEPFVVRRMEAESVSSLKNSLHSLSKLIETTIDDAESSSLEISGDLARLGQKVDQVEKSTDSLAGNAIGYADSVTGVVNRAGQVLSDAAKQLSDITALLPGISELVTAALSATKQAAEEAEQAGDAAAETALALQRACDMLEKAGDLLARAKEKLQNGVDLLETAVSAEGTNWENVKTARTMISDAVLLLQEGDKKSGGKGILELLSEVPGELSKAMASAADTSDALGEATKSTEKAAAALERASREMTDVLRDLDALTDYLADVDPLRFDEPSTYLGTSTESLYNGMQSISAEMKTLNSSVTNASGTLLEDFRRINEQIGAVTDLLLSELSDIQEPSVEILSDTSEKDINAATLGKLFRCENSGTIYGDLEVGGIVGSMSVYNAIDPEGDLDNTNRISNRRYELKCILQNCENSGAVTAKKNAAGGICGSSELGLIQACTAGGIVKSESGGYVGGIVGSCGNIVRNCWAKTLLSGAKYVGGILGGDADDALLTDISAQDCISMVEIADAVQYYGAIAGKSEGSLKKNRFVSDVLAGCNGLSRAGIAEPISYDTLLELEGIPSMFRTLSIRFVAEEVCIREITLNYGDRMEAAELPSIPPVEGCYGKWDCGSIETLLFDKTVTAVYRSNVTALASSAGRDPARPVFFVAGRFDSEAELQAIPVEVEFAEKPDSLRDLFQSYNRRVLEQWSLSFPEDGSESHSVRYLLPDTDSQHTLLYMQTDNGWKELPYESFGSYLVFSIPKTEATITVLASVTAWWVWVLLGMITAVVLLLMVIAMIRTRMQVIRAVRADSTVSAAFRQARRTRVKIVFYLFMLLILLAAAVLGILLLAPGVKQAELTKDGVTSLLVDTFDSLNRNGDQTAAAGSGNAG